MAIPVGTKLGPYEVLALIGAGGMGEVHRARDTRLGRDVAIKTLPAGLGSDPDRIRRFELEARAAGLLSHPNILTVYDVGTSDGQPYIVSELLEGENLRQRLNRGLLTAQKSAGIAAAAADGLAAAHARGIVHRDLKPENLFLTRDGQTKILDFGIAKLTIPESDQPAGAATRTILTDLGTAIGTLGYMAPEQVRGEPADARSDIFALGAILYEMLAGVPAFRTDSRVQTVNAVLESDPPPLPDTVAPALQQVISRCVEKTADNRFQTARDLAFALRTLTDRVPTAIAARPTSAAGQRVKWWIIGLAAAVGAAITGAAFWMLQARPSPERHAIRRFSFQPPAAITYNGIALSPDGTRLVYPGGPLDGSQLYMRTSSELDAKPLPGTESARIPFFSPDGQWIAFEAGGKLRKIPTAGGSVVTLCDVSSMLEGTWAQDGSIVISQRLHGLMRVSAEGGTPQPLTTPDASAGEIDHHAPHALPGGGVLYTIHAGPEVFRIAVRTPAGETRRLLDDGFFARYVPSGHIVYARADGLFSAPFDLAHLQLAGPSVLVVENVALEPVDGTAEFAVATDGTLASVPAKVREGRSLVWVDRAGKIEPLPLPPHAYNFPVLSPDGKRLAVQITEGVHSYIWIYEFGSGALTRLSSDGLDARPVWSRDGTFVVYASRRQEERHILRKDVDASTPAVSLIVSRVARLWPAAWTTDSRLIYVNDPPTSLADIRTIGLEGNAPPENFVAGAQVQFQPDVSPDGKWLAFARFERRSPQIFVRPLSGGEPRQITTDRGMQPKWSPDGREIFFRRLGRFMHVAVQTTPVLQVGKPEPMFDDPFTFDMLGVSNYDVARDGQRFLMVKGADTEGLAPPIHLTLDWFEELKRRVPVPR